MKVKRPYPGTRSKAAGPEPAATAARAPAAAMAPALFLSLALALFLSLALLAAAALSSCGARAPARAVLPSDPPLSRGLGWAVVVEPYAPVRSSPSAEIPQEWSARKGSVLKVTESRYDPRGPAEGGVWYSVSGPEGFGWLHSSAVRILPSEARAKSAAARLASSPPGGNE